MVFPSCTHREPSASFAASGVKTQDIGGTAKGYVWGFAPPQACYKLGGP
jgi:hypothetical protein